MKRAAFKHCDHKQTLGGKGDVRRPSDKAQYEDGWERIFGKNKEKTKQKAK